jgi:hypothetical protein
MTAMGSGARDPSTTAVMVAEPAVIDPLGSCPVCGCALGRSGTLQCQVCSAPHHEDCWTYNGGCATFACPARARAAGEAGGSPGTEAIDPMACPACARPLRGPTVRCRECSTVQHVACWTRTRGCAREDCRANPARASLVPLPEKIELPRLRVGLFLGIDFVPLTTVAWCIGMELAGFLSMLAGFPILSRAAFVMLVAGLCWAAITAERYNINMKWKAITKSKLLCGIEVLEWVQAEFDDVAALQLVPDAAREDTVHLEARVRGWAGRRAQLTPPFPIGSGDHQEIQLLLERLHHLSVVRVPQLEETSIRRSC